MTNDKTKVKARNFAFILYPESLQTDWQDCLIKLGIPMAISPLHDKDKSNIKGQFYKKPHYHVLYIARNPVTPESVRLKIKRALGSQSISHVEIVDSVEYYFKYLTHESADAIKKNKHKYNKDDIAYINNFDIDRYVVLDESQKRELKNLLLDLIRKNHLVNVVHLLEFIDAHGEKYGITNTNDVNEVVTSNAGGFRLWFDANYQDGYRRPRKINPDTGEIIENAGYNK